MASMPSRLTFAVLVLATVGPSFSSGGRDIGVCPSVDPSVGPSVGPSFSSGVSRQTLRVVESLDLTRYAGRWYEVARLPNTFQDQCAADVVVQYALRTDGRMEVVNRCRKNDGTVDEARGLARKAGDGRSSAKLEVRFAPAFLSFLPMVWSDYWIIGLGPEYTWAVVGVPRRTYVWILSRTPGMSAPSYGQALEIAKGNGFDVTRLVKTPHGS